MPLYILKDKNLTSDHFRLYVYIAWLPKISIELYGGCMDFVCNEMEVTKEYINSLIHYLIDKQYIKNAIVNGDRKLFDALWVVSTPENEIKKEINIGKIIDTRFCRIKKAKDNCNVYPIKTVIETVC